MREVTLKVQFDRPAGTQLEKLARKSCTSYIYIGKPTKELRAQYGDGTRIQLNDKYADASEVYDYAFDDRNELSEQDKPFYTVSLKVDKDAPMGYITDVKEQLRKAYALKIMYSAVKEQ